MGAYTVTYNVQDFAGNTAAQVTRTVNVTAATGRGGGGGGSFGYWALALLVATQTCVPVAQPPGGTDEDQPRERDTAGDVI